LKYRSRLDIIAMMLEAIGDGSRKTKIMYDAYLSYKQMGDYLEFLLEKDLVTHDSETGLYKLTENGRLARSFIGDLEKLVGVAGRRESEFEKGHRLEVKSEVRD
jgi:predicted transcriptional regulator